MLSAAKVRDVAFGSAAWACRRPSLNGPLRSPGTSCEHQPQPELRHSARRPERLKSSPSSCVSLETVSGHPEGFDKAGARGHDVVRCREHETSRGVGARRRNQNPLRTPAGGAHGLLRSSVKSSVALGALALAFPHGPASASSGDRAGAPRAASAHCQGRATS
jgi:hypothetical protein